MANQKKDSERRGTGTGGSAEGPGRGGGQGGGQGGDRRLQRGVGGGPVLPHVPGKHEQHDAPPDAERGKHEHDAPPLDEEREARKD